MVDDTITGTDWNALYIDSEWTEGESGESIAAGDPSTRETVAHVPRGTEADVDAAYEAAAKARELWAEALPARRQEVVEQSLQALSEYEDGIIDLLAHEVGGSRIMGEASIQIASDHVSKAATLPRRVRGRHVASNVPGRGNIMQKNPKGVVTVISPWNFPPNPPMRAVVPVVTTGNTVALEPSTNPSIIDGLLFTRLFEETDLPEGVVNVIIDCDSRIGNHVAGHPESDVMAFTDSTGVDKRISGIAGEDLAVPAIELGGNSAHVMTESADVDRTTNAAVFGNSVHQEQVCISTSRRTVHELVCDEYVEKLTERAAELSVGSAHEDDTVIDPIIDGSQCDKMPGYVERMIAAGTTLGTGGLTADLDGIDGSLVVQPTVLSGVVNDMTVVRNEHFGPIAPVIPFSDVDGMVELANAAEYGLSGSIHVGDLAADKEIALRMKTGNVHVNDQPINDKTHVSFSGTGASGVGIYNSDTLLSEITEDRWISLQHEPRDYPL